MIQITTTSSDPPSGQVAVDGGAPVAFEGWLGLLATLSALIGPAQRRDSPPPPR